MIYIPLGCFLFSCLRVLRATFILHYDTIQLDSLGSVLGVCHQIMVHGWPEDTAHLHRHLAGRVFCRPAVALAGRRPPDNRMRFRDRAIAD